MVKKIRGRYWFVFLSLLLATPAAAASITGFASSGSGGKFTFIQVPTGGGTVTFAGTDPIKVAGSTLTTTRTITLPDGPFAVTDLNTSASGLTVTGATFLNNNTNANILNASDNYIKYFRQGQITVPGFTPGQKVPMQMLRLGWDIGAPFHSGEVNNTSLQNELLSVANDFPTGDGGMWGNNEPTQGKVNMAEAEAISKFAIAHNATAKLHNLAWSDSSPDHTPPWVLKLITSKNRTGLIAAIKSRIDYYMGNEKNNFTRADGINEYGWHSGSQAYENVLTQSDVIDLYKYAITKLQGGVMSIGLNTYAAAQYASDNGKYLNQIEAFVAGGVTSKFYAGVQDYIDGSYGSTGLQTAQTMISNLLTAGVPIEMTEFGLQSSVPTSQAAGILDNTMRLMFGTPNTLGFIGWYPLPENGAFAPDSYLFDSNGKITAAGLAQQALYKKWFTQSATLTADSKGNVSYNGYYGDYLINGKKMNFAQGSTPPIVVKSAVGDYNNDGVVNAADYTVWRSTFGSTTDLRADGNNDGVVNVADYAVWTSNMGTVYAGVGASSAVPEPTTRGYVVIAVITIGIAVLLWSETKRR